jgi:hypothetical protein
MTDYKILNQTKAGFSALDSDNNLKVLLLLGIGIFMEKPNIHYMEIMKRLADAQRRAIAEIP